MTATGNQLSISMIVPVYRGGERFVKCLASIANADPSPSEIIVVADGAIEADIATAERFGSRVISLPQRGGPGRARNTGARQANGDILYFVDADVTIPTGAIAQVNGAFISDPTTSAIIGSYDDNPAATNFLSQYRNLFHHYIHQISLTEASTFWGACGAIKRNIFCEQGGFYEGYSVAAIEDIELGYRLKDAGYEIRLCKNLQVKHLKVWTPWSLVKTDFFCRALPWTQLILRRGRASNDLNLRMSSRLSIILVYAMLSLLIAGIFNPMFLAGASVTGVLLLAANVSVYLFFLHKRGLWFTVGAIGWHWFYYLYGGLAFAVGLVRHIFGGHGTKDKTLPQISQSETRSLGEHL